MRRKTLFTIVSESEERMLKTQTKKNEKAHNTVTTTRTEIKYKNVSYCKILINTISIKNKTGSMVSK